MNLKSFDLALSCSIQEHPELWNDEALIEAQVIANENCLTHSREVIKGALAEIKIQESDNATIERELEMAQIGTSFREGKHSAY